MEESFLPSDPSGYYSYLDLKEFNWIEFIRDWFVCITIESIRLNNAEIPETCGTCPAWR